MKKISTKLGSYIITLILLLSFQYSQASPAYPHLIKMKQASGETLNVYIKGDESFSYYTSEDGYVLSRTEDGFFVYADQNTDSETIVATEIIANDIKVRNQSELDFLATQPKGLTDKQKEFQKMKFMVNQIQMAALHQMEEEALKSSVAKVPRTGDPHFLVLLFNYSDIKFSFSHDTFNRMLNQQGFSDDGATGSVGDFYRATSWNQFRPVFDVVGPIELPGERAQYGGEGGDASLMFRQGAQIAHDHHGVDFSQYDFDNDGVVDNVYGFFAGYDRAQGGGDDCVWSHASSIRHHNINLNGVYLGSYACSSELKWNWDAMRVGIGTFVHEFGHVLGLPDFYDTDGDANGRGHSPGGWTTMAGGAYNNDGHTPPLFGIMEREMLGWCNIPTLPSGHVTIHSMNSDRNNPGYKIPTPTHNEFYVLEYREKTGFDSSLPGNGMLIWHVDKSDNRLNFQSGGNTYDFSYNQLWGWNSVNNIAGHPCYDLVESSHNSTASGDVSLNLDYMWPHGSNHFDPHSWSGASCNAPISNIVNHNNHATFNSGSNFITENYPIAQFYYDSNYSGTEVGLPEGEFNTGRMGEYRLHENVISSLKVLPGFKVIAYTGANFDGDSRTYTGDTNYVGNDMNDKISSIKIVPNGVTGLSGLYKVKSKTSEKYWDMDGNATENGTKLVQWFDEGSEIYQQFRFEEVEAGVYSIFNNGSNKVLDVDDWKKDNFTEIQIWDNFNGANQQFIAVNKGNDYYQFVARHCGKVIEIPFNSSEAGEWLKIYNNNNQDCSHWKLEAFNPDFWIISKEDIGEIDSYLDLRHNDVFLWGNLDGATENNPFEGNEAISWTITGSASQEGWFGFGIHNTQNEVDLGQLSDFVLRFHIKTNYQGDLGVKLTGTDDVEPTVWLNDKYAFDRNDTWKEISIPYQDFINGGLKLGKIKDNVLFAIIGENVSSSGAKISVDNVYYRLIEAPYSITASISKNNANIGDNITLTANAVGDNLTYQWKKDGNNINGANNRVLNLENIGVNYSGLYTCEIRNQAGAKLSNECELTVNMPTFEHDITKNGGNATSSHQAIKEDENVWRAIDNDANTKYCAFTGEGQDVWIAYESTEWIQPTRYTITSANDFEGRDPKNIKFQGSSDGSNWETLDSRYDLFFSNRYEKKTFDVNTNNAYKAFRLLVTERRDAENATFQLAEWQIFGDIKTISTQVMNDNLKFDISPNPFKNELFVKSNKNANVKIINTAGVALINQAISSGTETISTSKLPKGVYIVEITVDNIIKKEIFIKH